MIIFILIKKKDFCTLLLPTSTSHRPRTQQHDPDRLLLSDRKGWPLKPAGERASPDLLSTSIRFVNSANNASTFSPVFALVSKRIAPFFNAKFSTSTLGMKASSPALGGCMSHLLQAIASTVSTGPVSRKVFKPIHHQPLRHVSSLVYVSCAIGIAGSV